MVNDKLHITQRAIARAGQRMEETKKMWVCEYRAIHVGIAFIR